MHLLIRQPGSSVTWCELAKDLILCFDTNQHLKKKLYNQETFYNVNIY